MLRLHMQGCQQLDLTRSKVNRDATPDYLGLEPSTSVFTVFGSKGQYRDMIYLSI